MKEIKYTVIIYDYETGSIKREFDAKTLTEIYKETDIPVHQLRSLLQYLSGELIYKKHAHKKMQYLIDRIEIIPHIKEKVYRL